MNTRNLKIYCLTLAAAMFSSQAALSATVYQWTDEEGVVHFSDIEPKDAPTEIEEIEFATYNSNDADPEQYSISNQLERMAEWRRQIAEERMAKKQLQLEARRIEQERNAYQLTNNYVPEPYYQQPAYIYPSTGYFSGHQRRGHSFHGRHFNSHKGHTSKSPGNTFKSKIDMH